MLVLAVVTSRFRVPLLWSMLDHGGSSSTQQRIELLQRYVALFGTSSIAILLADREFIGAQWLEFLCKNSIPFAIRLKKSMRVQLDDGRVVSFQTLLRKHRRGQWKGWLVGMDTTCENCLGFAAKKLKGDELLIVVTNNNDPKRALNDYRKRWRIECLFGDTKTRGFNMEDTRMRDGEKLSSLLGVIALALAWAYRCATKIMGRKAIRTKTHGRPAKSWFRIGLDQLRNWIIHKPEKAISVWIKNYPKQLIIK